MSASRTRLANARRVLDSTDGSPSIEGKPGAPPSETSGSMTPPTQQDGPTSDQ